MNEPSRYAIDHALSVALMRRRHLQRDPLAMAEAIAEYHTAIAATANHIRAIIRRMQLYPDMRTPETDKVIALLREQITSYHFNTFGVMPAWETSL